ncbi:PST family polysaccharide transporter [Allocatelliglobosispora scoriae]|uniref:PST family polysaccharide transporter n=1 Tax=Allocatelliglobosispora scoriae TaxID=643052 RepID=A0A841BZJ7_9ACTN|nr:oligosaccharide flippase family protein [Allocatelliglobosispora scoriae]MBB5872081.1 PST family polysaccharide transporter [Allocatelliglobosispora scoriae]
MTAIEESTPAAAATVERGGGRLSRTLAWSYVYTAGGYLITALLQLGLAAVLTPRQFGVMTLAMLWVTLALVLLEHGPTMAVIQHNDITEDHLDAAFWSTVGGAVVFTLLFIAITPLWAAANGLPEMIPVCLALAPVILLSAINVIPDAVLNRKLAMKTIAVRVLAAGLAGGLAGLGAALAGAGVWALVTQQLVTPVVAAFLLWRITPWRPRRPRWAVLKPALIDIRTTSLQTISGSIGNFIATRSDAIIMGQFLGPTAIGQYRFAQRFSQMALDISARGLQQVSLPELARHNADNRLLAANLRRLVHLGMLFSTPVLAILAASAESFANFIGPQWADATTPLRILCAFFAISVIGNLLAPGLQAAQRPGLPALFTWIAAGLNLAGMLLAVWLTRDDAGITRLVAIAVAAFLGEFAITVAMIWVTYRRVLRVPVRTLLVPLIPVVLVGGITYGVGYAFEELLPGGINSFLRLVIVGSAAAVTAGTALVLLDSVVRQKVVTVITNRRARSSGPATPPAT